MNLSESKQKFVQLWGNFGTQWGINRTMAQVHALLLSSDAPLCTEEIMEILQLSRGGVNTNVRDLIVWNLIYKESFTGDRREFFRAEKDMWTVAKRIIRERKRREIEPLKEQLQEIKTLEVDATFLQTLENIERLVTRMDSMSDTLMRAEEHVFFGKLINLFK